jgi:hypothetical protein
MTAQVHINGTYRIELTGTSAVERAIIREFMIAATSGKPVRLIPGADSPDSATVTVEIDA